MQAKELRLQREEFALTRDTLNKQSAALEEQAEIARETNRREMLQLIPSFQLEIGRDYESDKSVVYARNTSKFAAKNVWLNFMLDGADNQVLAIVDEVEPQSSTALLVGKPDETKYLVFTVMFENNHNMRWSQTWRVHEDVVYELGQGPVHAGSGESLQSLSQHFSELSARD